MMQYIFTGFWGLIITISMVGWGLLLVQKLYLKKAYLFGLFGSLGISFVLLIGGILNYFRLINRQIIFIILSIGCIYFIFYILKNIQGLWVRIRTFVKEVKIDKILLFLVIVFITLFCFEYITTLSSDSFNKHDDLQAYFVFPEKMLQTGSLGNDPFSERKIINSLGGKYFLDTLILSKLSWNNLNIIDRNVSLILLILIIIDLMSGIIISQRIKLLILISATLIIPPTANITALFLPTVLFLALFYLFKYDNDGPHNIYRVVSISVLIFGISCLKSSLIPAVVLLFLAYFIFSYLTNKNKKIILHQFFIISILTLIFLIPWMLAMFSSSKTFLYPLLGSGYHGSVYGNFLKPYSQISFSNILTLGYQLLNPIFLILSIIFFIIIEDLKTLINRKILYLCISVIIAICINSFATAGYGVYRYTFSFVYSFIIFVIIEILERGNQVSEKLRLSYTMIGLILISIMFSVGFNDFVFFIKSNLSAISYGIHNRSFITQKDILEYNNMQSVIPDNEILLTRLEKPFLLNFKRNSIYIADYPGGSSLPPGLPFKRGPEELARYFLQHSIKYLAFSYASQVYFTKNELSIRLEPSMNAWIRTEAEHTFDFQDNLMELYKTRKVIYDDGRNFVLDLSIIQ